jgi:EAL domain-containing protein (putative c-di-GMP-specific phosphodiesterase class I)
MYAAKKTSAGYSVYASDQDQHTRDRLALVEGMRTAIESEGFDLFYQPKMDMRTKEIIGVEALARWNHPELGYVPPDTFIPLAEHTGLIRPLTSWVLEEAIKQVHEWHSSGMMLSVAINLSMRNVSDVELPAQVWHLLEKYNVPANKLTLEITESSIAADPVRSTKVLSELHEMGVEVSIDDFGTGHSSLSRLRELRIDEIKIDRSFVMDMSHNDNDAVIVRSTIDLGRNLGLRVVAEGIEDEMTLHRLATLGCDVAQGYHLSRPLPADDVHDWVKWYQREALGSVTEDEPAAV